MSFIVIFLFLSIISCQKEDVIPTFNEKYVIELDRDNTIHKVNLYRGLIFQYYIQFIYTNEYVRAEKYSKFNDLLNITQYYLNNGLADSCVDSIFSENQYNRAVIHLYEYDQGYRTKHTYFFTSGQTIDFSNPTTIEYFYEDGNMFQFVVMGQCTGNYLFTELPNKLDISSFTGDYMGKQNSDLYYYYSPGGCPSGPSTVFPKSTFTYTLNEQGYVTERICTQTAGHHSSDDNPAKMRTITRYEYMFLN